MILKKPRFRGGVHPAENKDASACRPIRAMPLPTRLYVPLQQHIGTPAEPVALVGQHVLKGQVLGEARGMVSAPVHAPTSGVVVGIEPTSAPHPSGLPIRAVILEPDGEDRWIDASVPLNPFDLEPEEIAARVGEAGIVGLGGATFPAGVKLNLGLKCRIDTLLINAAECEPYLTCDDRLMRERAADVVDGVRILRHGLQCARAIIVIEDNKPEAYAAIETACAPHPELQIRKVPTRYPMGSEKQMIQAVTGLEVPSGARPADVGILMHNVGTAYAVHQAVRHGRPLVSRIVTVTGGAVREPANLEVPLGMLVSELLENCGLSEEPARLLMGGPMMGQSLPHTHVPVVKGTSGVLALAAHEAASRAAKPCIRCARCVAACPIGLMPLEMANRARHGDLDGAVSYGLAECIACGSCAYVCPAHIPLVHYFLFAKGELAARAQDRQKSETTRRLMEERRIRLEREAQAKAEKARAAKEARNKKTAETTG